MEHDIDELPRLTDEHTEGCGDTGGCGGGVRRGRIGIEHSDELIVFVGESLPPEKERQRRISQRRYETALRR